MAFFDTMETDREMRRRAELSDLHDAIRYLKAINANLVAALEAVLDTDTRSFLEHAEPHPRDQEFTIAIHISDLRVAAAALAKAKKR